MVNTNFKTKNVDKGYAWFVLVVAVLLNMLGGATMCSFGIFYIEIVKRFEASNQLTSAVGLFLITSNGSSGLFLGPIIRKFGPRIVAFVGTGLHVVSLILTIFVTNIYGLFIVFGLIPGIGMGCQQMAALAVAQLYFVKWRALAIGIVTVGFAISNFAFGPICALLIGEFGWQGGLLLLAGIIMQGFVLSALIRPIDVGKDDDRAEADDENENYKALKNHPDSSHPMEKIGCEPKFAPQGKYEGTEKDDSRENCCSKTTAVTGLSFFCIPLYALFWIGMVMNEVGHGTPGIYLPLRAVGLGVSEQTAAFTVSTFGIVSTFSKVVAGFVVDLKPLKPVRPYLCGIGAILTGTATLLSVFITDFKILLVYSAAFGGMAAIYVVMQFATFTDFYGRKNSAIFIGHVQLAAGVATAILTSLAGALLDASGDAARPFLVNGSVQVAGGILLIIASLMFTRMGEKAKTSCVKRIHLT